MPVVFDILLFKLVNYSWSCSQEPINDNHLVQVDEFWYLMKHQIKHLHQVFIWGETYFSSEIKHLHFNGVDSHNSWKQWNTRENISLYNFLFFHLRRHHSLMLSSFSDEALSLVFYILHKNLCSSLLVHVDSAG